MLPFKIKSEPTFNLELKVATKTELKNDETHEDNQENMVKI